MVPPSATSRPTKAPDQTRIKSAALDDTNGNQLADVDEEITYSFVLTNTGKVTLSDLSVDDPKAGTVTCPPAPLAPGDQVTCTADTPYTVTEQDILDGGVVNSATGFATTPPGVDPIDPPVATITTPTATQSDASDDGTDGHLPATGSSTSPFSAAAGACLAIGGMLLLGIARRRRRTESEHVRPRY